MGIPVDLRALALSRLLTTWKEGVGNVSQLSTSAVHELAQFLDALTQQTQDALDTANQLVDERQLMTAVGAQLDQYGDLVNEPRAGRSDAEYLVAILARIVSNGSSGTAEELIAILSAVTGATLIHFRDQPVGILLEYWVDEPTARGSVVRGIVARQMQRSAGAGIPVRLVEAGPDPYFGFAGDPRALGFGEGKLASEYLHTP